MNAPNLAAMLNTKADDVKRPVTLPDGTFYGIIKSHQYVQSSQKKTPGVQYRVQLTHAHDDVNLSEFENEGGVLTEKFIDNRNTTFWFSENSLFMFTDFIQSLGIETAGRSVGELAPQAVGQPVMLDVVRKPNQRGDGYFNEVTRMTSANAEA